jgi:hypothetical protein
MIANYGICLHCSDLIENKEGSMWRDIDGHSFSLVPLTGTGQFTYHVHSPIVEGTYKGHGKYQNLDAEILDSLAMEGYASDSVGDQATYGFYDLFSDYRAILISESDGFVRVAFYDSDEMLEMAWNSTVEGYTEYDDEPLYDEYGDDEYAYESGAYESDIWD